MDFAIPVDWGVKTKESEKLDKYLDFARDLKKLWNMKVTVISIVVGMFGTVYKSLEKKLEELKIRKNQVHTDHNIVKIGLNTEKSPGNIRRPNVTSVK